MTPEILSAILWVPYLFVTLIAGLIYTISGYKKGIWCALVGLGATLLSAVISMLLSNWISGLLSPGIVNALPPLRGDAAQMEGLIRSLLGGVLQYILALVFFMLLLFVLNIILRAVSYHLVKKKLQVKHPLLRWGGAIVGLTCALVYGLLFCLPLYGSLATYMPAAEQILTLAGQEAVGEEISEYTLCVSKHPVVQVSGSAPIAALYQGTTQIKVGENGSVNVAQMAATLEDALGIFQQIVDGNDAQRPQLCYELMALLREKVVEEPWAYDVAMELVSQLKNALAQQTDQPDVIAIRELLLPILEIEREEFRENGCALLEFAMFVLEHDGITLLQNNDIDGMRQSGILLEAGKLANVTEQAVQVKNLLWNRYLFQLCKTDMVQAKQLISKYPIPRLTDPRQLEQEAQALMLSMGLAADTPAEFVLRHPSLGEPVLQDLIARFGFAPVMGLSDEADSALLQLLQQDADMQTRVLEQLRNYADRPLGVRSFGDYCEFLTLMVRFTREGTWESYGYQVDADMLAFAIQTLKPEMFETEALPAGIRLHTFLSGYPALLEQRPELLSGDVMSGAAGIGQVMSAMISGGITEQSADMLWEPLANAFYSDLAISAAEALLQTKGDDPLQLRQYVTGRVRKVLEQHMDQLESFDGNGLAFPGYVVIGGDGSFITDGSGMSVIVGGDGIVSGTYEIPGLITGEMSNSFAGIVGPDTIPEAQSAYTSEQRREILSRLLGLQ